MIPPVWQEVVVAIHHSGRQLVISATGGGTGAIAALLQTPGASRSVLDVVVPYSLAALVDWIGGKPDQACSEATARAMAMAAFMRARKLAPQADPSALVGVGCTASLATDRPKRGQRRVHVALQTSLRTAIHSLLLVDDAPTRAHDEEIASALLLSTMARGCGVEAAEIESGLPGGQASDLEEADVARRDLFLGKRRFAALKSGSTTEYVDVGAASPIRLVFPGAFNPPHVGHLRMAEIAEKRFGQPLAWELSIANVDKPPLDFIAIRDRVNALRREDSGRLIVLTSAPTFVEKSELFPEATFVVGADTMARIAEPRYYGNDVSLRDAAVADLAKRGLRFLVFGRVVEGRFTTLHDLELPAELRRLCDEAPAAEFREDVSSTALRATAETPDI